MHNINIHASQYSTALGAPKLFDMYTHASSNNVCPYPNNIANSPTPTMLVLLPEYHSSTYDFN